ncbi:MAG: DUF4292 domain-containing protein [Bacteroidota bacterium]
MKYIVIKVFCLLAALLLFMSACKTKKGLGVKLPQGTSIDSTFYKNNEAFINNINQQQNTYNYLSCKGECEYSDGKNDYTFDISLEMEKGHFIFIKATYLLGIEVARLYITPSQIQIIDHWNKVNTLASYSFLKKYSSAPLQFENIENMLIGNALFTNTTDHTAIDSNQAQFILKTFINEVAQICYYNKGQIAKINTSLLQDSLKNQQMDIAYKQFFQNGTNYYPSELAINIRAEKNVGCSMKLFNFVFEKKRDPQIRVPNSYKTIAH